MNVRAITRIARAEVSKGVGTLDRRTVAMSVVGVVILVLLLGGVALVGVGLDDGLYRVGIAESDPLAGPVIADSTFIMTEPDEVAFERGDLDLLVRGTTIHIQDTPKGHAALAELRSAVKVYNDQQMGTEPDQAAAFPIRVTMTFHQRAAPEVTPIDGEARTDAGDDGVSSGTDDAGDDDHAGVPAASPGGGILDDVATDTPSGIAPPFPFQSLLLAFLFVIPMNFVIQAYGGSFMAERINRRGELLLVTPVSALDIVAGMTLPYLVGLMAIVVAITVIIGGGFLSVLAVIPIALLFLSTTFVAALFARSFKELTFLTVTISVLLTSYLFIPAIFSDVGPIALISPLTLVVRDLQGSTVSMLGFMFSVGPALFASAVLFGLGLGIFREEDLFTQRPVHLKAMDALVAPLEGVTSVAIMTVLFVPFVFAAQLLALSVLFVVPLAVAIPILFLLIAIIEEIAKSIHIYAGFAAERFPTDGRSTLTFAVASGMAFFLAEKAMLVVQLVGLTELELGRLAFTAESMIVAEFGPILTIGLLLAPLALHVTATSLAVFGARSGRTGYMVGLTSAILLHFTYNAVVIAVVA